MRQLLGYLHEIDTDGESVVLGKPDRVSGLDYWSCRAHVLSNLPESLLESGFMSTGKLMSNSSFKPAVCDFSFFKPQIPILGYVIDVGCGKGEVRFELVLQAPRYTSVHDRIQRIT